MIKRINESNIRISTVLTFILLPFSGLATDAYLPSFPEMARVFRTSPSDIQQTLVFFLVSYGLGQIVAGSILDSLGRRRLTLLSLLLFTLSNFVIISATSIVIVFLMRSLQGLCTAFIMVSKRAFFVDVYEGKKQRHYTSLVTVVWSVAPIMAPFIGGYLQLHFGWKSNFYLLAAYTGIMLVLEWIFSGESLKVRRPLRLRYIIAAYRNILGTYDFILSVLILGSVYSMVMIFNMSIPFIVEEQMHYPPSVTGYCALISGLGLLIGNFIGKMLNNGSFYKQMIKGNSIQYVLTALMFIIGSVTSNLVMLMVFVILIHITVGALFNRAYTYSVLRFPENAGLANGIAVGGNFVIVSLTTPVVLGVVTITGQQTLAIGYVVFALLITGIIIMFRQFAYPSQFKISKA